MSRRSYRSHRTPDLPQVHTFKKVTRTYVNNRDYTDKTDSEENCYCDVGRDHTQMNNVYPDK